MIGGGVGLAEGYLERVRAFQDNEPNLFKVDIRPASLGKHGPLLGALMLDQRRVRG